MDDQIQQFLNTDYIYYLSQSIAFNNKIYLVRDTVQPSIMISSVANDNLIEYKHNHELDFRIISGKSMIINNELHTVSACGARWNGCTSKHLKYNENLKKFQVLHQFDNHKFGNFGFIGGYKLATVREDKILMFGGCIRRAQGKVHKYNVQKNRWTTLGVEMPLKLT